MDVARRMQPAVGYTPSPRLAATICAALLSAGGCVAPFSEMQGARLVGPGNAEITPSYSYVRVSGDGEAEKAQDDFALQLAVGVHERVDLRGRYELIRLSGEGLDYTTFHAVGFGPKIAIVPGRVAFYAPFGLGFGGALETSESLQFQPTALFTIPVSSQVEINPSAKAQIWLNNDETDDLLAFNIGLGLGPDLDRWAIRPEVGMLIDPGEEGRFWHFSLGFSRALGNRD
jgi:hypothetical protein